MEIRLIDNNDSNLLEKCKQIAEENPLDNHILLGDLHQPCIQLTRFFGLFSESNELKSFFVIFDGFENPSVVIPFNINDDFFVKIMKFLQYSLSGNFAIVSTDLTKEELEKYVQVNDFTSEHFMVLESDKALTKVSSPMLKRASFEDKYLLNGFYRSINAYPWTQIQLQSNFYFYLEKDEEIIAAGGTHFEAEHLAQLGNIFVLEEFRGKGYGEIITSAITQEILSRKKTASLFVLKDNTPAINLYKKLGFEIYKSVHIFSCELI